MSKSKETKAEISRLGALHSKSCDGQGWMFCKCALAKKIRGLSETIWKK